MKNWHGFWRYMARSTNIIRFRIGRPEAYHMAYVPEMKSNHICINLYRGLSRKMYRSNTLRCVTLHSVTSRHVTLRYVTSRHVTLTLRTYATLHCIAYCIAMFCVASRPVASRHVASRHVTSRYVTLRYVTLRLRYVKLPCILRCIASRSCHVTLRYVTLRYVTLRYVTLRYVTLRYILHCIALRCVASRLRRVTLCYVYDYVYDYIALRYITLHCVASRHDYMYTSLSRYKLHEACIWVQYALVLPTGISYYASTLFCSTLCSIHCVLCIHITVYISHITFFTSRLQLAIKCTLH